MQKILFISLAMLICSMVLFAQPAMNNKMGMNNEMMMKNKDMDKGQMMMKDWKKDLNLTEAQERKIEALKDEQQKFMNTKQAELKNLRIDRQNAMMNEDYTKAKQVNKSITDLQLSMQNAMVDHMAAVMKELTPEQKTKLKEMHKKGMGMGMGMMGNGMMGNGMMGNGMMNNPMCEDCPNY